MSDQKKAALQLAKLDAQVADAGLHIIDGPNPTFRLDGNEHEIWGTLSGTHQLTATKNMYNHNDVFDFTISGGHNFNMTIMGFQPQTYSGSSQPYWDGVHDLLELNWDPFTGVTNLAQAQAAEHTQVVGHDMVLTIDAPHVHGTITFTGLADYILSQPGDHFGWHNDIVTAV